MKDQKNISMVAGLHPAIRSQMEAFIDDVETQCNCKVQIVQGYRTFAEQQAIYDQGRTQPGHIVTWSPPGSSYHNYGLAADLCPYKEDGVTLDWNYDFSKWAPLAKTHGLQWGGDFPQGKKDPDHFEDKKGYNWRQLLHKYNLKEFIDGTHYVSL